jgi:hypothetical protein
VILTRPKRVLTALVVAIPLEFFMFQLLDSVPMDVEPQVPPSVSEQVGGFLTVILHFPAILFMGDGVLLPKPLWFLIGYADILILWFLAMGFRWMWTRREQIRKRTNL